MADSTLPQRKRRQPESWEADLAWLVICAIVVVVSSVFGVNDAGAVTAPGSGGSGMPGVCMAKRMTGMDCPGCGMTRSFVAMGNGQVARAWQAHRLGPLLYLLVLVQIPLRAYAILRGVRCPWRVESWGKGIVIWLMIVLLFANWIYSLQTGEAFR